MSDNREREEINVIMESTPKNNSATTKPKPNLLMNKIIMIESPSSFRLTTENETENNDANAKVAELEEDDSKELLYDKK